jgi:SAM-dependent methyltransferase
MTSLSGRLRAHDGSAHCGSAWMGGLSDADVAIIERCQGPVLDIGCGPGRMTVGLAERGIPALGIDITPEALSIAEPRGAAVLRRDVFDRVPGVNRWRTVLLIDGNIGIGADPRALLDRASELLRDRGRLIVEVTTPDAPSESRLVRVEIGARAGPWFGWIEVDEDLLIEQATSCGFDVDERWAQGDRRFLTLESIVGGRRP